MSRAIAAAVRDYRELARRRLPHFLFEYIDGGAYDEITLRRNIEDLQAIALRQRILCDVSRIDLTTRLFGQDMAMPIGLAPVGLAGMNARRGEVQAARAAEAAKVPFCLSTVSLCAMDEVAGALKRPFWFQLYLIKDRGFVRDMLAKAKALGCSALVFTVDLPTPGARYRDVRSGLTGAPGLAGEVRRAWQIAHKPGWAWDVGVNGRPHQLGNIASALGAKSSLRDFLGWIGQNFDASANWRDLEQIRQAWDGPLIVKGILDPGDAVRAADLGADGIVVSNHGGRQLDGVLSSARALPPITEAVGGRLTILADGGVRSGLDVVRLLALGAQGVLIGRAWAYALAGAGQAGVSHVLSLMAAEMRVAMALTGVTKINEIDRSSLAEG
ncbi:FMN-dependent L-lactate dehydrogenase LldD [Phenylobacterium montanum]|uniref:FMN-dependent L-lactate dehydrogenase LldD n=1 Tax=Phenylobacterium montanum TaxID=2823693 RepID=A0A975G0E7_9CAUL|nr:FMN-dependent L-lactate dehydrogenase LldD [Caulobacter sp. S6]QUD88805.1 FMN-dependent L-lactate dehydrogenase LldD [Caulobacter sp. S6]